MGPVLNFFSKLKISATTFLATIVLLFSNPALSKMQEAITAGASGAMMLGIVTSTANTATGTKLLQACKASVGNFAMCVMAGLSFAQAGAALFSAKQAKDVAKASYGGSNWDADWRGADLGNGMTGAGFDSQFVKAEQQLNQAKKDLLAKGIDIDKGTVKTPKGTKALDQVASSGQAMADAGLISSDQIEDVDKMLAQQKDAFKNIALNNSTGGGGGGGRLTSSISYDLPSYDYSSLFGDKQKPNEPKTAGLVKMVNGEPIGGSTGNIFDMIHNRYQIKNRERIFVE